MSTGSRFAASVGAGRTFVSRHHCQLLDLLVEVGPAELWIQSCTRGRERCLPRWTCDAVEQSEGR